MNNGSNQFTTYLYVLCRSNKCIKWLRCSIMFYICITITDRYDGMEIDQLLHIQCTLYYVSRTGSLIIVCTELFTKNAIRILSIKIIMKIILQFVHIIFICYKRIYINTCVNLKWLVIAVSFVTSN